MTNERARKQQIRDRMQITGEPYSVAARELSTPLTPVQAFFKGYGVTPGNPRIIFKTWVVPVFELVTYKWDADTKLLEELGSLYRKLDDSGHYFCHHHVVAKSIMNSFKTLTVMLDNKAIPEAWENFSDKRYLPITASNTMEEAYNAGTLTAGILLPTLYKLLQETVDTAKDSFNTHYYGLDMMKVYWSVVQQGARTATVWNLVQTLKDMPSLEEVNTPDIRYSRYFEVPPVAKEELTVGDKVKFVDSRRVWTVKGVSENFAVLVNSSYEYTIIDWRRSFRGAHNSYGYPVITDEDIQKILEALELKLNSTLQPGSFSSLELGRNQVPLRIKEIRFRD